MPIVFSTITSKTSASFGVEAHEGICMLDSQSIRLTDYALLGFDTFRQNAIYFF